MSDFYLIVSMCIISALFSVLLKQYVKEQAFLLSCGVCCILLLKVIVDASQLIDNILAVFESTGIELEYYMILTKSIGIAYLSKFGEDICKDCGENAISSVIMIAGRISMSMIALPVFKKIIDIVIEVLQ